MRRRSWLLAGCAALFGASLPLAAHGLPEENPPPGRTVELHPKSAPYPVKGGAYEDDTVLAFIPEHFVFPKSGRVDVVLHFHGHKGTAHRALRGHLLREQLNKSKQNAVLVVPQGPVMASDGDFGKLMKKNGVSKLLTEVLSLLHKGDHLEAKGKVGRVVVSAHSGGYRAAAEAIHHGGVDLREVYLFDALYGELDRFESFASKKRKLVSYFVGGDPMTHSLELAERLRAKGVAVKVEGADERLDREDLVKGKALFLRGRASHGTATFEEGALRDCLLASCLRGIGTKAWHSKKDAKR
jgi:hypothetical protein